MKERAAARIPTRKISETILDFGEPLPSRFDETPPIDVMREILMTVITVWNAHVLAMPMWGEPEHLERLTECLSSPGVPEEMRGLLDALVRRRNERFKDDPRAVGEWAVKSVNGEYGLRCDARLPHGATVDI
jgi:hypothetical protein